MCRKSIAFCELGLYFTVLVLYFQDLWLWYLCKEKKKKKGEQMKEIG